MNKQDYLAELRVALGALSAEEAERTVAFYAEAIEDRMEAGAAEEEAVADLEAPASVAARLVAELPAVPRLAARLDALSLTGMPLALVICAVILGSPLWIALFAAGAAAVFSVFVALFAVLLGCWSVALGLLIGLPCGVVGCVAAAVAGSVPGALGDAGMGLLFGGAGLFCLHGCYAATGAIARAMAWLAHKIFSLFGRGGELRTWNRAPMGPVWKIVHRVALAMLVAGAAACLAAWGLTGFDGAQLALELGRGNAVVGGWLGL